MIKAYIYRECRQKDRKVDRQVDRYIGKQKQRQIQRQIGRQIDKSRLAQIGLDQITLVQIRQIDRVKSIDWIGQIGQITQFKQIRWIDRHIGTSGKCHMHMYTCIYIYILQSYVSLFRYQRQEIACHLRVLFICLWSESFQDHLSVWSSKVAHPLCANRSQRITFPQHGIVGTILYCCDIQ